jgi:hypothetical protein
VRETFKGFVMLRLLAFVPLLIVIAVLVGISALARGSDVLGIVILAGLPVVGVFAFGWLLARRARHRREPFRERRLRRP